MYVYIYVYICICACICKGIVYAYICWDRRFCVPLFPVKFTIITSPYFFDYSYLHYNKFMKSQSCCGYWLMYIIWTGQARSRTRYCPVAKVGSSKYGPNGLYIGKSFEWTGLSFMLCEQLANAANYSLSKSTWSSYKTVRGHLERCQNDLSVKFSFPMTTNQVLCFVSWLMKRGLEAKTINAYLSGLRTIHLIKGIDETTLRPAIVAAILEGKAHIDTMKKRLSNKPAIFY